MAYVPPHLRKKSEPHSPETQKPEVQRVRPPRPRPTESYSIRDIQHHYWKHDENSANSMPQHSTLNDSLEHPGVLTHVLLFHGANPRWTDDGIIFVKSNLEILPCYKEARAEMAAARSDTTSGGTTEDDETSKRSAIDEPPLEITPSKPRPIAIFEQSPRSHRTSGFHFSGFHTISHIAVLSPRSRALTRMLEQKWALQNGQFAKRRQEDWEKSLGYEWAAIKFVRMGEGEDVPSAPVVERVPQEEPRRRKESDVGPRKSVNEMLAEMRFGEEASGASVG